MVSVLTAKIVYDFYLFTFLGSDLIRKSYFLFELFLLFAFFEKKYLWIFALPVYVYAIYYIYFIAIHQSNVNCFQFTSELGYCLKRHDFNSLSMLFVNFPLFYYQFNLCILIYRFVKLV
jgi:hypothetical protein